MCAMSGSTTGAGSGSVAAGREECRCWLPVMNLYYRALPSLFSPYTRFGERRRIVRRETRYTGRLQVEVNEKKNKFAHVHVNSNTGNKELFAELNPSRAFRSMKPLYIVCGRSNSTLCGE